MRANLGDRLVVGLRTLTPPTGVRIPLPQPNEKARKSGLFFGWGRGKTHAVRPAGVKIGLSRFESIPRRQSPYPWISARATARAIILSRRRRRAFLLSLSRSAGIAENAVSIAMSFASAKFTFINRNSCSILSSVWSDNSFPLIDSGCDYRHIPGATQRRNRVFSILASHDRAMFSVGRAVSSCQWGSGRSSARKPPRHP